MSAARTRGVFLGDRGGELQREGDKETLVNGPEKKGKRGR